MEEQDIPIDINSGKLLEWLINRRHCTKDWQTKVLTIREKINNAIQDMPVHDDIAKLLSGTYINYFHCIKIIEILRETEADSKNMFGRYGSQRMKDWQEIVRLYEKDNLYLAEAAQMLMRNINYEVPSFKKQIQKLEQMQSDLEKRESECKKSENAAQTEFNNLCKQLGIKGKAIKKELLERISELPEIYDKIVEKTKTIGNVVEFYSAFVEFTLGRQHDGGCLPMIKYIIDKGNTSTYEWKYGESPVSILETPSTVDFEEENNDFEANETNEAVDIDWGDEVDYGISLEESGIVVEDSGHEGGVATGAEALTILDNPATRNDFIDQLFELQAFLKFRLYEFKGDDNKNLLSMSQMQEASPILQLSTLDSVQNMLDNVQVLLSEISDSRTQHLHNIKHSPRYVEALEASLRQKLTLIDKMIASQTLVNEKREETRRQIADLQPVLKLVIQRTKELQTEIERDISKKYKNRVVHLTGGVNTL